MRNVIIDKSTRQVLSVGIKEVRDATEDLVPFDGPLPQDTTANVNIQDYKLELDDITLTYNPAGNQIKEKQKEVMLNNPVIKALIEELETQPQFAGLRDKLKARL